MKFSLFLLCIQKECFSNDKISQLTEELATYENIDTDSRVLELDNLTIYEPHKKSTIIRSCINRSQARLFDILTIRIVNTDTTLTQMYYNHEIIHEYLKGLNYNKLHKVVFRIENVEEFKELERKLVFGNLDVSAKVFLPCKESYTKISPPFSKIIVRAHFFQEEKRNMFYQKISKTFKILQ